jgi:predicted alpha-1,2-mannosidase
MSQLQLTSAEHGWEIGFVPDEPGSASRVISEPDHLVQPGDVLEYEYRPAEGVPADAPRDADGGHAGHPASGVFAATAVAVLPICALSLAEGVLRDQHGVALTAVAQGRSRTLRVDDWNRKVVDLAALVGSTITQLALVVDSALGEAVRGSIRGVRIGPASRGRCAEPGSSGFNPLDLVDTRRGSDSSADRSRGNTVPAAALPAGFALTFPVTDEREDRWPYVYGEPAEQRPFHGLRVGHTATPWLGDYGVLQMLPISQDGVTATFRHEDETARPHIYGVTLSTGATVRAIPTAHGMIGQFGFPSEGAMRLAAFEGALRVEAVDDRRVILTGHSDFASDMLNGAPRVYFWVEVCGPGLFVNDAVGDVIDVHVAQTGEVLVRVGTSLIDVPYAERHAHAEAAEWAAAEQVAADEWARILREFVVYGATDDQRVTLYSSLYRIFLYPSAAEETAPDGRTVHADILAPTRNRSGVPRPGRLSVNNGFWDTYRTLWPAYALFAPERAGALLDGFVSHFVDTDWMPRWSAPHAIDIMVGTSSDIVFADAIVKGVPLTDPTAALRSAIKNATVASDDPAVGRKGLVESAHAGHASAEVAESVAWTLEGALNDFGILVLIERRIAVGETEFDGIDLRALAAWFRSRAAAYALLFDPETRFFRPRVPVGEWPPSAEGFEPREWGGAYTETNAWGMRFSAPHDGHGLAALHGGPRQLRAALDEYFETAEILDPAFEGSYGRRIHEMREARDVRMGMFALSNQPAHHVPFLYAFTDAPHETGPLVREALRRQFLGSERGQGYPGDEDNGEMSAWFVFAALGLYPLAVGTPWYVVTAPLFDEFEVPVAGGRLRVTTSGGGPGRDRIAAVSVDGAPLDGAFVHHEQLLGGCHIHVELTAAPGSWQPGAAPDIGVTPPGQRPRVLTPVPTILRSSWSGAEGLVDGSSRGAVDLPPSAAELVWRSFHEVSVELITFTSDDPLRTPRSWRLDVSDDGETWMRVGGGDLPRFRWPRQTIPVAVDDSSPHRLHRLRLDGPADSRLSQVTLLGADALEATPAAH